MGGHQHSEIFDQWEWEGADTGSEAEDEMKVIRRVHRVVKRWQRWQHNKATLN